MPHSLEVYEEHAHLWTEEIISAIDSCGINIVKSRAGCILEERLGITNARIESWKSFVERGGSRKLDPLKGYASIYSAEWMISLNA